MLLMANVVVCVVLFFLIYRKKTSNLFEMMSLFWLKSIITIVVLYLLQLAVSPYGVFIPINLFTFTVALLFRIPGLIGLGILFKFILENL